jgi:hypothetical protein
MALSKLRKRRLLRNYKYSKKVAGEPSLSDAKNAYELGVIDEREYKRVKSKYSHNALSKG